MRVIDDITGVIEQTAWQWYDFALLGASVTIAMILLGVTITTRRERHR